MLYKLSFLSIVFSSLSLNLSAHQDTIPGVAALKHMSLEELMNISVITASGDGQRLTEPACGTSMELPCLYCLFNVIVSVH